MRPEPIVASRPEGMLPVCSQCRRDIDGGPGAWRHVDDDTPRCPVGLAEAVRRLTMTLAVVGLAVRRSNDGR